MNIFGIVRHILYADSFVAKHKAEEERQSQRGIALIAMGAFLVMSLLNIRQKSYLMLATTGSGAVLFLIGYLISKYLDRPFFLKMVYNIVFIGIFTGYTIMGGNEGFAALWLIVATYAVMLAIDSKMGFCISLYYLIMLLLVFIGPLSFLLQYEYNRTFLLRFPFLYAINFAFATYIMVRIRLYQYELLIKQQELEHMGTIDLGTGLRNRNSFIDLASHFSNEDCRTLTAVFIDVNGLHEINNKEGHAAGDQLLVGVAELCKKYFPYDTVYRMGGDEFLILCRDVEEEETNKLVQLLQKSAAEKKYSISCGVEKQEGVFDLNELVKQADLKMMQCKRVYYETLGREKR